MQTITHNVQGFYFMDYIPTLHVILYNVDRKMIKW
jgi:hypothetical protein